jgi:hypothetical protein
MKKRNENEDNNENEVSAEKKLEGDLDMTKGKYFWHIHKVTKGDNDREIECLWR